jgi:hypothetical protein
MTRRTSILWGLVALAAIVAVPASASTFVAMDEHELVAASVAVVEGRVLEVHSFWNADGTAILTEATIQVNDVVAGRAADVVTVRTFGGQVGDHVIEAHGFPTFQQGEQALLFLQNGGHGALRVTGYQLGHYRIRTERGQRLAVPTMEAGIQLLRKDGTPAPLPRPVELEGLKDVIRSFAARKPTPIVK